MPLSQRAKGRIEIEQARVRPPYAAHLRVWFLDSVERQVQVFGSLLQAVAPGLPGRIELGFHPSQKDNTAVDTFMARPSTPQLPILLESLKSQNLQIYWDTPDHVDLVFISELYDDHVELLVPHCLQDAVQAALARLQQGAV